MRPIRACDIKARTYRSLASFLIKPPENKQKRLHLRLQRGSHGQTRGARRAKSDRKSDRRGVDGRDQQIRIGGNPHTDAG